jgi:ATP-dependent exoDNAse (exonuclease V) beta subunit
VKGAFGNVDDIEEERRVLYVALTRAKDELIISRRSFATHAINPSVKAESQNAATAYFYRPAWWMKKSLPRAAGRVIPTRAKL